MQGAIAALRRATGTDKTREQICNGFELPPAVRECISRYDREVLSPYIAVAAITDPTNPAYRADGHVDGRAEMCVATRDLDEGTCLGCYPGSGRQWRKEARPTGAFEDGYCIQLRDKRGLITPNHADPNPLSRCNDYRTNIGDPRGFQGRKPNTNYVEIWLSSLPYAVFFTTRDTQKGEEILWDYGPDYWSDAQVRNFRCLPLQEQANTWNEFMDDYAVGSMIHQLQLLMCSEAIRVTLAGVIWASLMATKQETLAALWISACALLYGIALVRKRNTRRT